MPQSIPAISGDSGTAGRTPVYGQRDAAPLHRFKVRHQFSCTRAILWSLTCSAFHMYASKVGPYRKFDQASFWRYGFVQAPSLKVGTGVQLPTGGGVGARPHLRRSEGREHTHTHTHARYCKLLQAIASNMHHIAPHRTTSHHIAPHRTTSHHIAPHRGV
jgi:hypothetical protein